MAQVEDRTLIVDTSHIILIFRSTTSISSMWMEPLPVHHRFHLLTLTLILKNHNPHILRIPITPFTRLTLTFRGQPSHSLHYPNNSLGSTISPHMLPQPHNLPPQLTMRYGYPNQLFNQLRSRFWNLHGGSLLNL